MTSEKRIQMSGIGKRFGATEALRNVSLSVNPGEVRALIGENGAGKSTLMKILSGAITPDSGTMYLDGKIYSPEGPHDSRLLGVGMIYQELSLADHLSVEENIFLGVERTSWGFVSGSSMREISKNALEILGHGELDPTTKVSKLSLAIKQVVEIARAIVAGCNLFVFDEPTSSLTLKDTKALFTVIRRLKSEGKAIVYISHFLEEVREICDTFTVLRDGEVVSEGNIPDTNVAALINSMTGRDLGEIFPSPHRSKGELLVKVENLSGVEKPINASFEIYRGEVLGIAGLIGSGRTELIRALFGLDPIRSGSVKIGVFTAEASPSERWAQGIGYLSEDRGGEGLALSMSIADNLTLTDLKKLSSKGFLNSKKQIEMSQDWIKSFSVKATGPTQKIGDLSGGNQQKVALARLFYHDVDLLILDEPTRGIDVKTKAAIYDLIRESVEGERKRAVLLISSSIPEVMGLSDRVAVMSRGVLGEARAIGEITERQILEETTGQFNIPELAA